jgi:hypothetical protein
MAIALSAVVDCKTCGVSFDGEWVDNDADSPEDVDGTPVAVLECPSGHKHSYDYPGWTSWTEAG